MSIFKNFFGEGDEDIILEENKQLRKKRKRDKEDYEKLKEEYNDIVKKYISLLEEKGKGFDQYIYYHDLYGETYNLTKEQKKEIAELKSEVADSYLNWLWWIIEPICFMLIYTFIFGYVFKNSEQYFD